MIRDIESYIGSDEGYCTERLPDEPYVVGIVLGTGIDKLELLHDGSILPDGSIDINNINLEIINVFDMAEVQGTNIGQINMSVLTSFKGKKGVLWGLHLAKPKDLYCPHPFYSKGETDGPYGEIPVYSAKPLRDALLALFGTVDNRKFPPQPGAVVHAAASWHAAVGPSHVFGAVGFALAKNPVESASLFMENVGTMTGEDTDGIRRKILENIVKSIVKISKRQKAPYECIFVDIIDTKVQEGEVGLALVAAPYFRLARKAVPFYDLEEKRVPIGKEGVIFDMTLEEWMQSVRV